MTFATGCDTQQTDGPAPLHVVVDAGVDDAVALAVLIGRRVSLAQVVATEGSLSLPETAAVTTRLLATLRSAIPVRLGAAQALDRDYPDGRDPFHGADGFGGCSASLVAASTPTLLREPLRGPVFATAALTVVAEALLRDEPVSTISWMGGSVRVGGNMTAAAEFNAWMDPLAADTVLSHGVPVVMVPLDVTVRCAWSPRDIDDLADCGDAGRLLADAG